LKLTSFPLEQFYGASSFQSDLSLWNVDNVVDMGSMFERAASFTANLYNWGSRLTLVGSSTVNVDVKDMFANSACPVESDPITFEEGPWCTGSAADIVQAQFYQ
jgi:surface protein